MQILFYIMNMHVIRRSNIGDTVFVKDKEKYVLKSNCSDNEIRIGHHVWIGYGAKILKGAMIGDGSIVGTVSIVNKPFSNNVIIAGSPAKVVQKNIVWSRNVQIQDLEYDDYVLCHFASETKDI